MRAPPEICTQCQTRVPSPRTAPGSTIAVGWTTAPALAPPACGAAAGAASVIVRHDHRAVGPPPGREQREQHARQAAEHRAGERACGAAGLALAHLRALGRSDETRAGQ